MDAGRTDQAAADEVRFSIRGPLLGQGAATRAFYAAAGFRPLEELPQVWGPEDPCLLMVRPLQAPAAASSATSGDGAA